MENDSENTSNRDFGVPPDVPSNSFFSTENTAQIGRFTIPFPFSAILGLLMIPVLIVAAGVSIPVTLVGRYFTRRREAQFGVEMKLVGRWISWDEASSRVADGGTFIEEYLSFKGPYRLWWTSEDISKTSPHPCCFQDKPWEFEDGAFFDWCGSRFTDPVSGAASIVDYKETEQGDVARLLAPLRTRNRCISIHRAGSVIKSNMPTAK